MDGEKLKEFVLSSVERLIKDFYKGQLDIFNELNQKHLGTLFKYEKEWSPEMKKDFTYFDAAEMGRIRKKTLDNGNETLRKIKEIFDKLEVDLK